MMGRIWNGAAYVAVMCIYWGALAGLLLGRPDVAAGLSAFGVFTIAAEWFRDYSARR